jgi:hypothetical protein
MSELSAEDIVRRWDALKSERGTWEAHWQEVLDFTVPRKSDVQSKAATPGARKTERQYDATAAHAAHELAASLVGHLVPRERAWFRLTAPGVDGDRRATAWLDGARDAILDAYAASNFHAAIDEAFLDLVTVGTGNLLQEERPIERPGFNGLAFQAIHIAEYVIDEDARGEVDTVLRRFELTARQAVQMFGADRLPDTVRAHAEDAGKGERTFEFVHAVYPRADRRVRERRTMRAPWVSAYIAVEERAVVREGGFQELPYHVARWSKTARERYGRSPAMRALPDVKTLNLIVRYGLEALPLALYPPFLVKEGTLTSGQLNLSPGAQNQWDGTADDIPRQVEWRGDIRVEMEKEAEYRARIERSMEAEQLRLRDAPRMTATEVIDRRERMFNRVGPTVVRIESELLDAVVSRSFMLMFRAGALGAPPDSLVRAGRLDVAYTNPLAQAARLHRLRGLADWQATVGPLVAVAPEIMDNVDADAIARDAADILALPVAYLRPVEAVAAIRQARAEEQARQRQLAEGLAMAEAAKFQDGSA